MIRFGLGVGICDVPQLREAWAAGTFGDRNISIELYPVAQTISDTLAEAIMFQLVDDRGVLKRTFSGRFNEFDRAVIDIIQDRFQGRDAIRVQDLAVSDGRTACDFYQSMTRSLSQSVQYVASDFSPEVFLVAVGRLKAILSLSEQLEQVVYPPFVINCRHWRVRDAVKNRILNYIRNKERQGAATRSRITLFCATALELAKRSKDFQLRRHDMREPLGETGVDIVRAMNIFNLAYFTHAENLACVDNIFRSLRAGGLFVMGSNEGADTPIDGAVYLKADNRFELMRSFGAGSRIGDIVESYRCGASPMVGARSD